MSAAEFRAALKALGWSQARAARELAVANQQRVSEWCRGYRSVPHYITSSVNRALDLAAALEDRSPEAHGF